MPFLLGLQLQSIYLGLKVERERGEVVELITSNFSSSYQPLCWCVDLLTSLIPHISQLAYQLRKYFCCISTLALSIAVCSLHTSDPSLLQGYL